MKSIKYNEQHFFITENAERKTEKEERKTLFLKSKDLRTTRLNQYFYFLHIYGGYLLKLSSLLYASLAAGSLLPHSVLWTETNCGGWDSNPRLWDMNPARNRSSTPRYYIMSSIY